MDNEIRLIDANALLKALKANCDTLCNDKNTNWCEHCCPNNDFEDLIDNAPTVDTTCPNCDSGYAQGYSDGYLKGKEERPQGKWIKDGEFYRCSECYSQELYPENFCYCCGADMRGKENECKNDT